MTILVVDDDQDDIDILSEAVRELSPSIEFIAAQDGDRALKLLGQMNILPNVIFVDRNMPRMSGMDFLTHIKGDSSLKHIPVVMHSINFSESDLKLYSTHGAYSIRKHDSFNRLQQELKILLAKIMADNITPE